MDMVLTTLNVSCLDLQRTIGERSACFQKIHRNPRGVLLLKKKNLQTQMVGNNSERAIVCIFLEMWELNKGGTERK